MNIQPSLDLAPARQPAAARTRPRANPLPCFSSRATFAVTPRRRLLDRALSESGLSTHEPVELASASDAAAGTLAAQGRRAQAVDRVRRRGGDGRSGPAGEPRIGTRTATAAAGWRAAPGDRASVRHPAPRRSRGTRPRVPAAGQRPDAGRAASPIGGLSRLRPADHPSAAGPAESALPLSAPIRLPALSLLRRWNTPSATTVSAATNSSAVG